MPAGQAADEAGFALIGVLWLVVLMAVVGLDFSLRSGALTHRAINAADVSIARSAAEGGLLHAEARLIEALRSAQALGLGADPPADPWRNPAVLLSDTLEIGDALCAVRLEDAGSRLHLNRATELELRRLMTALRIDDSDADRAAQAILDWRDPDDARRARGAELEEYLQADAPVLPADGPFGSVDELRHVIGVTPVIFERMEPFLTVRGSGRINLSAAPPEVIASLAGMSDELLGLILRARTTREGVPDLLTLTDQLSEESREAFRANLASLMSRVTTETQEVAVTSQAWVPGGASAVARAVAVRANDAVFMVERSTR